MTFFEPILLSIFVTASASFVVFFTAIIFAFLFTNYNIPVKWLWETLFMLPIVLSPMVIGFLLVKLFGRTGLIGTFLYEQLNISFMFTVTAAVMAAIVVAFPLMYQAAKAGFLAVPESYVEVTKQYTNNPIDLLRYTYIPAARYGLISGFTLSFARGLGEFGATLMFAGNIPGVTLTMPTAIYTAFEKGEDLTAWMYVMISVIISALFLYVLTYADKRKHAA
ncbi:molybdate ABC transporter permease subunit [Domibacillus epiphyticus]|uniref:ABC transmembrane type-1 domain-containing protein n=1 Tax=Domibacillus epiphyticus TaxID=1714355 RepID=A0A1V2A4L2_9BACI|nr:ABC transporter permease subunit [Domibacillus epiphyticus]OMP65754.1 hypothetical protein BTO28_15940 [Domibacillus epiphyticus]